MKFQDTPPTSYRKPNTFTKALGAHSGKWPISQTHNTPNTAHTTAWSVRKNRLSWTKPDRTYEARTCHTRTDRYEVWVRAVNAPEQ